MDIEEAGAPVVARFGPGAGKWLAEVPAIAARLASEWGVVLGELFASGRC
jgi:streptomycin 6-kinase